MSDRRVVAAFLVLAGVLAGHAVVPAFVHSHGGLAHAALHSHGWQPVVVAIAALAGFVGLARAVLSDADRVPLRLRSLVPVQVLAFALVELVELNGAVTVLVLDPGFWLGLVVQVGLAAVAVGLVRVGRRILRASPPARSLGRRAATRPLMASSGGGVASAAFLSKRIVRGPPGGGRLVSVR